MPCHDRKDTDSRLGPRHGYWHRIPNRGCAHVEGLGEEDPAANGHRCPPSMFSLGGHLGRGVRQCYGLSGMDGMWGAKVHSLKNWILSFGNNLQALWMLDNWVVFPRDDF